MFVKESPDKKNPFMLNNLSHAIKLASFFCFSLTITLLRDAVNDFTLICFASALSKTAFTWSGGSAGVHGTTKLECMFYGLRLRVLAMIKVFDVMFMLPSFLLAGAMGLLFY